MLKVKTSELTGAALDWAVAKCEGDVWAAPDGELLGSAVGLNYSTNWTQGGPIIERERLCPCPSSTVVGSAWSATDLTGHITHFGPTPLEAAMRCYVASKFGDTVEIPKELTQC